MANVSWATAIDLLRPHIVRISTPRCSGSGFLIARGASNSLCAVATAAHVVDTAHYWEEPVRLDHTVSKSSLVLHHDERAILLDEPHDTAVIMFDCGELGLPDTPFALAPQGKYLSVGYEAGWLGFPAIASADLCFFSGRVSAWLPAQKSYLVDGVAINGVSGGPAFCLGDGEEGALVLMGVVSAYAPNRVTGETLPGLSVFRDVSQFHDLASKLATLDQAKQAESPKQEEHPPSTLHEGVSC